MPSPGTTMPAFIFVGIKRKKKSKKPIADTTVQQVHAHQFAVPKSGNFSVNRVFVIIIIFQKIR
jgi:hypothetical protein